MAEADVSEECGFCYEKGADMQDPRVLTCCHVFCKGCLDGQLKHNKVIRCPACSKVFDVDIDNLPAYTPGKPKHVCDVCTKRGKVDQPAVMYCNSCTKKHCEKHKESHGDLHEDHVIMSIADYESQAKRLETKYCTKHKDQPFSLGCGVCLTVFCASCISPLNICTNGRPHELRSLGDLVTSLTDDINKLKAAMVSKEEKLSALFKSTSKQLSEVEMETSEMVEKLHQTRDKQIEDIQRKYKKLEEELIRVRKETRAEMMLFMEEQVGNKLTNITNHRMRIEARVRNNHQVDIINTYRDTQTEAVQFIDGELPVLSLDNVKVLALQEEKREIEAEIVPVVSKSKLVAKPPPESLSLFKSVDVGSFCHSLCHYKGKTYLGMQNCTIDVLDSGFNIKTKIQLSDSEWPYGVTLHQDNTNPQLIVADTGTIKIYHLNSKLIKEWQRNGGSHCTRPAVVFGTLVVPDINGNQLTLYSLSGQVIKHIPMSMLNGQGSAVCAVDESSVVVTSFAPSKVCRVDISSGQTLWTSTDINEPQAVVMYGLDLVCIVSDGTVSFLNVSSGQVVTRRVVSGVCRPLGWYVDMDIHHSTLIVSTCKNNCNKILFFKLS